MIKKILLVLSVLLSTQVLSYQEKDANGVAESVFTSVVFYYGDKYVALRDLMDNECNTLTSVVQDTCKRDNFDNYYSQAKVIKKNLVDLLSKVQDAENSHDFSNDDFPIVLKSHIKDMSAVVNVLVLKADFLSKLSHSMVDTGYTPLELKAEKTSLDSSEKLNALLELWNEFELLNNKENALLVKAQLSANKLSSITKD
jgi:hypothetical protein